MGRAGQAILAIAMMFWTKECEDGMREGGAEGLKENWVKQGKQVFLNC